MNVSSTGSSLNQYSHEIQRQFRDPKMTLHDLENLAQRYQVGVLKRQLACSGPIKQRD